MDVLEALDELAAVQATHDDFDQAIADDAYLARSQAAHEAYMRALFPGLDEKYLRFVLPQPPLRGVCL